VPPERVDGVRRIVELVLGKGGVRRPDRLVEPVQYPPVEGLQLSGVKLPLPETVPQVHHDEARRVPDLVAERTVTLDPFFGEYDVPPLRGQHGKGEAERVGSVLIHHDQGINDVPFRFAHLGALLVPDEGVDVHVAERHVAHELQAHHYHARDPEKDDVERGDKHARGIILLQGGRLFRPAQR